MVWSNWQGAIWRGAAAAMLFWAGLAWTQPPADPADRIVTVDEGGKKTRCRILETWRMPDGRTAQLLEALDTGEKITIVDEPGMTPDAKRPQAMPKRIFAWGQGRRVPPEGSPLPPHLRIDSGVVIKNNPPPPIDAVPSAGPTIVNRVVDEQALGGPYAIRTEGPITIVEKSPAMRTNPGLFNRLFAKREVGLQKPAEAQVIEIPKQENPAPVVINQPKPAPVSRPTLLPGITRPQPKPELPPAPQPIRPIVPTPALPTESTPLVPMPTIPETSTPTAPIPTLPIPALPSKATPTFDPKVGPAIRPSVIPPGPGAANCDPSKPESCKPAETVKKPWRPGANIQAWLQGKSKSEHSKVEATKVNTAKSDPIKIGAAKSDSLKIDAVKPDTKVADHLAAQNKAAEKQLMANVEKIAGVPFSTAMMTPLPAPPQPDVKKPEASPLAIPRKDDKPLVLPPPTPKDEGVKPIEKRDMWGNAMDKPIAPVGRSLLDPIKPDTGKQPAPARPYDPLLSPDRLVKNDAKAPVVPPLSRTIDPGMAPPTSMPVAPPSGWPLGTQSVQAAHSGLLGTPTYIPVPTVTVPQPTNPPLPPTPQLPEPPNLNAYVNAFTPPPAPKGNPQLPPMQQNMMTPHAMMQPPMPYYGAPMMQQPMMLTPQMVAQQQWLAQQALLMQYGYRPSPALMNPYGQQMAMMPSQGPMSNFSRHYAGPMPPNPFAANPHVQTGYASMPYPAAMPMQPMLPQQQMIQQVSHHPQAMPTHQPSATQQVEQLLRVLRESPYPAQREWAAQSLTGLDWRVHPQIVPALIQSASQDPAPSVRAGCVSCLGRMNAAVEPVFGMLHTLRNDTDPRVRQEVDQAFVRLGQSPTAQQ